MPIGVATKEQGGACHQVVSISMVAASTHHAKHSVSLSSTESELYALVSVACDGIFLKRVLEFVTGQRVKLQMRTDNQSFKQIAHKSGVSKNRHLDG